MDIAQLIISCFAAIGSVASGAMLAWSIYMFKRNLQQQELTNYRSGFNKIKEYFKEITSVSKDRDFKKIFRKFFKIENNNHNIKSIYNGMQVAYKHTPIKEYAEARLVLDQQFSEILFTNLDLLFRKIENCFEMELKKQRILQRIFELTYDDYKVLRENVIGALSRDFVVNIIHNIYYEQHNELVSFDQFVEKLSLKCTQQARNNFKQYFNILERSLNVLKKLVEHLLALDDKEIINDAKVQLNYKLKKGDFYKSCEPYFKTLGSLYGEIAGQFSQRELLCSQLNSIAGE